MNGPDLNLLLTLDILLAEGSVARAAKRLALSPSAMSRALARLRVITGDPLLVRAGRGLVPTPRADEMRESVRDLVQAAQSLLRPSEALDLARLDRRFVLRTGDGFAEGFGPGLIARVGREAPHVQLRFVRKLDKDSAGLRDGSIDLETGVIGKAIGPEVRARALFADRYIAVLRRGHPLLNGALTPDLYANAGHVLVWRPDMEPGTVDTALAALGLARRVAATVDGYAAALALARASDLVATVPARHSEALRADMAVVALPFDNPPFTISLFWHPRMDGDPAHRWLRQCVQESCAAAS